MQCASGKQPCNAASRKLTPWSLLMVRLKQWLFSPEFLPWWASSPLRQGHSAQLPSLVNGLKIFQWLRSYRFDDLIGFGNITCSQQSRMIHTENPWKSMRNLGQVQSSHVRAASQASMNPCWKMDELLQILTVLGTAKRFVCIPLTVPLSPKISKIGP